MDNSCNSHGLKLIDLCKSNSIRIANGRLGEDHLIGSYTYANYMGSSVIDYLLLHEHDFDCIDNFHVNPFSEWSDHAALTFKIVCSSPVLDDLCDHVFTRIKWNDDLRDNFRREIISKLPLLNEITDGVDFNDRTNVNNCVSAFSELINDVAEPLFSKNILIKHDSCTVKSFSKKAEWFDNECKQAKQMYINCLNKFNKYKHSENRIEMCNFNVPFST